MSSSITNLDDLFFRYGDRGDIDDIMAERLNIMGEGGICFWTERAKALLTHVINALLYLRDRDELPLSVDNVLDSLILRNTQTLAQRNDLPAEIVQPIKNYLRSLPGYKDNPDDGRQSEITLDAHGFLQMHLSHVLGEMNSETW